MEVGRQISENHYIRKISAIENNYFSITVVTMQSGIRRLSSHVITREWLCNFFVISQGTLLSQFIRHTSSMLQFACIIGAPLDWPFGVTSQRRATPMQAKWIRLDLAQLYSGWAANKPCKSSHKQIFSKSIYVCQSRLVTAA